MNKKSLEKYNILAHYDGTGRHEPKHKKYTRLSSLQGNAYYLHRYNAFLEKIDDNGNFQIRLGINQKEYLDLLLSYIRHYNQSGRRVRTLPLVVAKRLYYRTLISDKNIFTPREAIQISTGPILLFKILHEPINFCLFSVLSKLGAEAPFIIIRNREKCLVLLKMQIRRNRHIKRYLPMLPTNSTIPSSHRAIEIYNRFHKDKIHNKNRYLIIAANDVHWKASGNAIIRAHRIYDNTGKKHYATLNEARNNFFWQMSKPIAKRITKAIREKLKINNKDYSCIHPVKVNDYLKKITTKLIEIKPKLLR